MAVTYTGNCKLVANDGEEFELTKQQAANSKLCAHMFEEDEEGL